MPFFVPLSMEKVWILALLNLRDIKAVLKHHLACLSECGFEGIYIDGRHESFSILLHGAGCGTRDFEGAQSR